MVLPLNNNNYEVVWCEKCQTQNRTKLAPMTHSVSRPVGNKQTNNSFVLNTTIPPHIPSVFNCVNLAVCCKREEALLKINYDSLMLAEAGKRFSKLSHAHKTHTYTCESSYNVL